MLTALVLKSVGASYTVWNNQIGLHTCGIKGKLKLQQSKLNNPIAVGDEVELELYEEEYLIKAIVPRRNYIIRESVHKTEHQHIVASNLDLILIVMSYKQPRTSLGFLDRILVSSEAYSIPCYILLNKSDTLTETEKMECSDTLLYYDKIGYPGHFTSTISREGIPQLEQLIRGKKVLFIGHSGAGKTSLTNLLFPGFDLKTQNVSSFTQKGVHTTTFAEMHTLDYKTFVVDTPGIKEFGLVDMDSSEISHYFPEMRTLMSQCKYSDCTHTNEPGCRVIASLGNGEILRSRYKSYLSMLHTHVHKRR